MSAMLASSTNVNTNNNWYLNSEATNHLTNNLNNLTMGAEYQVQVGIYVDLPISHTSYSPFYLLLTTFCILITFSMSQK